MKKYTMPFAAASEHKPEHPDRTARKSAEGHLNFDVVFQVWPNRASLAKTVRIQQKAGASNTWRPCVALRETEGY